MLTEEEKKKRNREANKRWYLKNRDRILEQNKGYCNRKREINRRYYLKHRESILERHRKYYIENKDKILKASRKYQSENKYSCLLYTSPSLRD